MDIDGNDANNYQAVLRSIGSYLDEEPSCRISLIEVPDGFLVRMQRSLHKLEPHVEHFKRETLARHVDQFTRSNRAGIRQQHQGVWSHFPNGHQDFMRALGYELDDAQARNIVIDELEEGVSLSYTAPSAPAGWETRVLFLDMGDIETILNEAFDRRYRPNVASPNPEGGNDA